MTAQLALGIYRCQAIPQAAVRAAASGAQWVDTAPNYATGRARILLAPALAAHPKAVRPRLASLTTTLRPARHGATAVRHSRSLGLGWAQWSGVMCRTGSIAGWARAGSTCCHMSVIRSWRSSRPVVAWESIWVPV